MWINTGTLCNITCAHCSIESSPRNDALADIAAREVAALKRKSAERPAVVACALLPYDPRFELGATPAEAARPVALNHSHCARFWVLGGGSCAT